MNQKPSPINIIWLFMIVFSTVVASYTGRMDEITSSMFDSAKSAVTLAIGLIGVMALWLGVMKVFEEAGAMKIIARAIRPVMKRLFPSVPEDHPAMSSMIMNMAANALGLANAATPLGIKAMQDLNSLNADKKTASNAMCLFLAMNTSSVTILPLGAINIRAAAGASNPASILITSILATTCSTITAIIAAKLLSRTSPDCESLTGSSSKDNSPDEKNEMEEIERETTDRRKPHIAGRITMILLVIAFFGAIIRNIYLNGTGDILSTSFFTGLAQWLMPVLLCFLILFGYFRGIKVYEACTTGAKDGFNVAIRIIPFLVAIFVAIGMFRASGALDIMKTVLSPLTSLISMPPEALPMALIRPLSGSGAFGIMSEIVSNDPDSFLSFLVSTMQGSTETTFYVLAVYFGAVGISRTRHALPAALCADVVGVLASLFFCRLFW